jgi:hypothetical protein
LAIELKLPPKKIECRWTARGGAAWGNETIASGFHKLHAAKRPSQTKTHTNKDWTQHTVVLRFGGRTPSRRVFFVLFFVQGMHFQPHWLRESVVLFPPAEFCQAFRPPQIQDFYAAPHPAVRLMPHGGSEANHDGRIKCG